MRTITAFFLLSFFLVPTASLAQAPEVVPCGAFPQTPAPCGEKAALPADIAATLDGEAIRIADLTEKTRTKIEGLEQAVAEARRKALRREIDDVLLKLEASRRKVALKQLRLAEVKMKVTPPTDDEVAREVDAHLDKYRSRKEGSDWAAGALLDDRLATLEKQFIATLEKRFPVKLGIDAATAALSPVAVLATVGPRVITVASAGGRIEAAGMEVRIAAAAAQKSAIDQLVVNRLLRAEAVRRGVTPEELKRLEVTSRVIPPTDEELTADWTKYKNFYGDDFEKAKVKVSEAITRRKTREAEAAFQARLREGHAVQLQFEIPTPLALKIDVGGSPATGSESAAVTVVEWGDFECPPCAGMVSVIDEAIQPYGERVRYVFRQHPMSFHRFAWKASEAGLAAHAQGKFFPYEHILFSNQRALDVDSLKRYATAAGLDREKFDKDLDSGRFAADVFEDKRQGTLAGVEGTPTFFINGVRLDYGDYTVEGIRKAIDRAMKASTR